MLTDEVETRTSEKRSSGKSSLSRLLDCSKIESPAPEAKRPAPKKIKVRPTPVVDELSSLRFSDPSEHDK